MTVRRTAAVVMAVSLAVAAGCARVVSGRGQPGAARGTQAAPSFPSPSDSASPTTSKGASASASVVTPSSRLTPSSSTGATATVSCPTVDDTVAGIRYSCVTTGMRSLSVSGYSANLVRQTETTPSWFMSESSVKIEASDVKTLQSAARDQLASFLFDSYPDGSKGEQASGKVTTVDGKQAFLFAGLVTVDKSNSDFKALKAKQDRVVAVAILRGDGSAGMLIIAVPDTDKTLWPKMDTIATSARLS